jgi:MbtH protein
MSDDIEDTTTYAVVVNDEEQYSIWPADRSLPSGWRKVGVTGPKQDCLDHIEVVWTDMRPLSLRKAMAAQTAAAGEGEPQASGGT